MNKVKPTQGEWWYDGREIIAMPSQVKVAGYIDGGSPKEKAANVKLITNAKGTLKALERMDALFTLMMKKGNWGASALDADTIREMNEAPIQARAAIEKARGGGEQ